MRRRLGTRHCRGGEKQRLAFARIVLQDPDIIVLDEATAALDPRSQNELMELLVREPDHTTLISVGHRPELELFHTRKIVLKRRRGGTRLATNFGIADFSAQIALASKTLMLRIDWNKSSALVFQSCVRS